MSTSYSPSRSSTSLRLQSGVGGGVSRLKSSSLKQPPEPLRHAVADCLSSSSSSSSSSSLSSSPLPTHHGSPSSLASEASRTLRDYLAAQATIDLAYSVILEHTLAERERSPAVVGRCISLLKRYLLRYKPSAEALQLIDRFCVNIIAECNAIRNRKSSLWSQSLTTKSVSSITSTSTPPLPVSSYASEALVKSLHYVRSLVAQYMPKRSFQPAVFTGASSVSRQALPTLSSLLSRSFSSQLNPANGIDSLEKKETSAISPSVSPILEKSEGIEDLEFMATDVFKWRWNGYEQLSLVSAESDHLLSLQDMNRHNFLEVGAAALLVGELEAKMKGESWRIFGSKDMPFLDQVLQPSLLTTVTNSAAARAHLRAITASKRSKPNSSQIWEDFPVSTFRPRARPLFQYRHYSEQQPLRLNPTEVCEVIAAVCSETPPNANLMTVSSKLSNASGNQSMDVAASVLIKLVIDMYVLDPVTAAPLTLSMLQEMLSSPRLAAKTRAFDLIINLGVHAHLLEPMASDDASAIDEVYSQKPYIDNETQLASAGKKETGNLKGGNPSAISNFECWTLGILYEILLHLVQVEEKEESVWASALSCLLYFVCDRGKVRRSRLVGLDIRVIKMLIQISKRNSWAEFVHRKLICMLTNLFYHIPDEPENDASTTPAFLVDQVDQLGGIEFIFMELVLSNSREVRRNLYLVLFDYVLHQINEGCVVANISEYGDDEIQHIATLLTLADAPEALHISVQLGIEGIEELLKRSISSALSRYPNSDRLNTLLEKIVDKSNKLLRSFTHLDKEFTKMVQVTKPFKSLKSLEDGLLSNSLRLKVKLSWATLHSLLHSKRMAYRQNGYVWLNDLLMADISEERGASMCSNIVNLQQKIILAGVNDYSDSLDVPLSIWLMCGLLKSKNNLIRWGFLFVLERLLMRCKFLLDESDLQHSNSGNGDGCLNENSRLEKANSVIDIMSSALSLMAQINETDCMNILKMCDILFSQLCLKVLYDDSVKPIEDVQHNPKSFNASVWNKRSETAECLHQNENYSDEDTVKGVKSKLDSHKDSLICETASMAALLLRGHAIVPMQLVARVPAALFYWPLIQLAGAATDNIALGVSVGSKGRGNVPGATSDIRATLLLLLIGKCTVDPASFREVGGEEFFRELLDDTDARVAYYSSTFLLKRMMTEEPERYQRLLHSLISRAQQSNNEKLLENPYLQMRGLLQLSNE